MQFPELKNDDFQFIFESKGTSFLFEDLNSRHYLPGECVVTGEHHKIKTFAALSLLKKMHEEAKKRTVKQTEAVIAKLTRLADDAERETAICRGVNDVSKAYAKKMFTLLGEVCRCYCYFDPYYWDAIYETTHSSKKKNPTIELVQQFKNEIRARLTPLFVEEGNCLKTLLHKMHHKFGVPVARLEKYTEDEVMALFDGVIVEESVIQDRMIAHVTYKTAGSEIIRIEGAKAQLWIAAFDPKAEHDEEIILQGRRANGKGRVKGQVKILVRDYANAAAFFHSMNEMEKGSILVSTTTDPDMLPAFQKAAGVVTDVGGMLSHAAITARELGIPCIVETRYATQILKDGDMVELDMEKGIITILKR